MGMADEARRQAAAPGTHLELTCSTDAFRRGLCSVWTGSHRSLLPAQRNWEFALP